MKLCIANTTKQCQTFTYCKIEAGHLTQIPINRDDQIIVLDGMTEGVDVVVQHCQVYGLVDSTRIDQSQAFVGLYHSLGELVSASVIEKVTRDNDIHLIRGVHGHRRASIAALDSPLRDSDAGYSGEMGVDVEQAKGREDNEDAPVTNETIVTEKTRSKKK